MITDHLFPSRVTHVEKEGVAISCHHPSPPQSIWLFLCVVSKILRMIILEGITEQKGISESQCQDAALEEGHGLYALLFAHQRNWLATGC